MLHATKVLIGPQVLLAAVLRHCENRKDLVEPIRYFNTIL